MRSEVARAMHAKGEVLEANRRLFFVLIAYEELNLKQYVDDENLRVLTNTDRKLRNLMDESTNKQKNPFLDVYHWVQGELFDLQAVHMAI